jgi:hypothetical protein
MVPKEGHIQTSLGHQRCFKVFGKKTKAKSECLDFLIETFGFRLILVLVSFS